MYPGPPIAHVFDEAPGRIRVTPSPRLSAPIVAADLPGWPGVEGQCPARLIPPRAGLQMRLRLRPPKQTGRLPRRAIRCASTRQLLCIQARIGILLPSYAGSRLALAALPIISAGALFS